jgi:hypothetical protein
MLSPQKDSAVSVMRRSKATVLTLWLILLGLAVSPLAAQTGQSPYEKLDPDDLARKLRGLKMTVMLDSLVESSTDGGATDEQLRLLAQAKLASYQANRASAAGQDALQSAIQAYEQLIERFEQSPPPRNERSGGPKWIQYCQDLLQRAKIHGSILARPYADKILHLYAGPADYEKLGQYTRESSIHLDKLRSTLQDLRDDWNSEATMLVLFNSKLSHLEAEFRLTDAWTKLFTALSMQVDAENPREQARRNTFLDLSANSAESFLRNYLDRYPSAAPTCNLILGIARREQGRIEDSVRHLEKVTASNVPPAERFQGAFELAKTHLEQGVRAMRRGRRLEEDGRGQEAQSQLQKARGVFENAQEHMDDFRRLGYRLDQNVVQRGVVDVFATLLSVYRYESWAKAEDPNKAQTLRERSQQLLVDFFEKYKDDRQLLLFFSSVLAQKFESTENLEDLNSMILFALALRRFNQGGAQSMKDAQEMIDIILKRRDEISKDLHPRALWLSANMALAKQDYVVAADTASRVAREYPDSEEAYEALDWACVVYGKVLDSQDTMDVRRKAVDALELLLEEGQAQWAQQSRKRWFDLGWHREKLAETLRGSEKVALLEKAVTAYSNVPKERIESVQAEDRLLRIRLTLLEDRVRQQRSQDPDAALDQDILDDAAKLAEDFLAFEKSIPDRIEKVEKPERRQALRNWAASSVFQACRLRYDILGRKEEALAKISELSQDWPDTTILPIASGFYVEKLIMESRIDDAIAATKQYEDRYGPERSRALMIKLMNKIRDSIERMQGRITQEDELKRYRQAYYVFADKLYTQSKESGQTPEEQMYRLEQILANALYEVGKLDESMEHFQSLQRREQRQHELQARKISQRYDQRIREIRSASGRMDAVKRLVGDFIEKAPQEYPDATRTLDFLQLSDLYSKLQVAGGDEGGTLSNQAAGKLIELLEKLKKEKIETQQQDPINLLGVARIHAARKEYDKAEERYVRLARGLTPRAENLYWTVWLEYGRVMLEAHSDKKDRMEDLKLRLQRMLRSSEDMGGLRSQFGELLGLVNQATR